ncbi:hypothetical protein BDL97_12G015700 [Sphagnum fallax]|nr:hypothetical protein BDL97_12G015700 [Sphagnum fallax]KAH8944988.1 hypothetical protein BDL97_12G015700 [Sphagnum fallax]KAH8944989.1 hypothetical protein BDL97_12G015700 [Sphagnum fallax]
MGILCCKLHLVLLLLLSTSQCIFSDPCSSVQTFFDPDEMAALQGILQAWNQTPDMSTNLAGWNSSQLTPCFNSSANWKGVTCYRVPNTNNEGNTTNCSAYISGLSLTDASIVGTLPEQIGNLSNLFDLDLHNCSFNGTIDDTLFYLSNLVEVDLSANQFTGQLPNFGGAFYLQTLNISHNQLWGPSPPFYSGTTDYGLLNLTLLTKVDFSGNKLLGPPPNFSACLTLQFVNLSSNLFMNQTYLPYFNNASTLTILDLSNNNFIGSLPDFSLFPVNLQELILLFCSNLDNNQFNGTLNIDNILNLERKMNHNSSIHTGHLQTLSIRFNNISGVNFSISDIENVISIIKLQNNPYCSHQQSSIIGQNCYCNQTCVVPNDDVQRNVRRAIIIATTISGTMLVLVIAIGSWLLWRNKQKHNVLLHQAQEKFVEFDIQPTIFSYSELRAATKDFHPDMKLGQGSYGVVYKGIFPNKNEVAVKQLFNESQQSIDEFLNEIVLITGVKHRNLVKLKGCCITTSKKRLFVYEYVENNDLAEALFGKRKHMLNWPVRLNICLGVAHGLFYLHDIAQPRIIHRDIKASNILLDKGLQARIADFGLALLFPEDQTHITTMHIAGTKIKWTLTKLYIGIELANVSDDIQLCMFYLLPCLYATPEYATRGQLTEKVDVYSFGVLVLEVMSGRKNIDPNLPPHDIYLLDIAWRLARRKGNSIMNLVDCTLELNYEEMKEALRVVKIALLCLQQEPDNRPTMARVVAMLQGEAEIMEIVLDDNLEIESMNKAYENTLSSSKITFSSTQCFEKPNVAMLKRSASSSQIYDFAPKCQPFEIESFNK